MAVIPFAIMASLMALVVHAADVSVWIDWRAWDDRCCGQQFTSAD
ncbi:hypothetical protein O9929_15170 [Vibrio lentus]|nr:hypothetical protein [Vibrio lentus]